MTVIIGKSEGLVFENPLTETATGRKLVRLWKERNPDATTAQAKFEREVIDACADYIGVQGYCGMAARFYVAERTTKRILPTLIQLGYVPSGITRLGMRA